MGRLNEAQLRDEIRQQKDALRRLTVWLKNLALAVLLCAVVCIFGVRQGGIWKILGIAAGIGGVIVLLGLLAVAVGSRRGQKNVQAMERVRQGK